MDSLRHGVVLYFLSEESSTARAKRILLSEGTEQIQSSAATPFCPDSFIPKGAWREPSANEVDELLTDPPITEWNRTVAIVAVPKAVLNTFEALQLGSVTSWADIQERRRTDEYSIAVEAITSYLRTYATDSSGIVVSGLVINQIGLPSVTFDQQNNCFIGMHLDSWDALPLDQRHRSSNRFVLNLGSEPRSLVFINQDLETIYALLRYRERGVLASEVDYNGMVREFMSTFPRYPVVRVLVAPGEAYIAPTENIIHDGYTVGRSSLDIHLTVRGHFRFP